MNRDGTQGVILTTRSFSQPQQMPPGTVTVFPKGLIPDLEYDVRFDFERRVEKRLGADLIERGVACGSSTTRGDRLPQPGRPSGKRHRHDAPGPPRHVIKRVATNIQTQGVEVRWEPAADNHWLSGYEAFRVEQDGARISLGKICRGEYVFDHSRPGTDLISCRYEVRAFDGDNNVSPFVEAALAPGESERHHLFEGFGDRQGFQGWTYEVWRDDQANGLLAWHPEAGYEGHWLPDPTADERTLARRDRTDLHAASSHGKYARVFKVTAGRECRTARCRTARPAAGHDTRGGMPRAQSCSTASRSGQRPIGSRSPQTARGYTMTAPPP